MTRRILAVAVLAVFAAGCASTSSVMVYPPQGRSAEQMVQDQSECKTWADQQAGSVVADAAKGGALGGVVGGAVGAAGGATGGAIAGSAGKGAGIGAVVGAIAGVAAGIWKGVAGNQDAENRAYAACMNGRGYTVR